MKYIVTWRHSDGSKYVVGFTNSMDNFLANNAKKTYPYRYTEEDLTLVPLTEDVFSIARIEGQSNFADYLRF